MTKAKILSKAASVVGKSPLAKRVLNASKVATDAVQDMFYANRHKMTVEQYALQRQTLEAEATEIALKRTVGAGLSPRWSQIYRDTGRIQGKSQDMADNFITTVKGATNEADISRAVKVLKTEERMGLLEDVSRGNWGSERVKKNIKYYDIQGSRVNQSQHPELFDHAMERQGFGLDALGNRIGPVNEATGQMLKPVLMRPKRSGGSSPHWDMSKDENLNMVQYMLHQGKKNKMDLEDMLPWFGDDYANVIIGRIAKQNNITKEAARGLLLQNGGLPQAQIKNGSLFIDQVVMAKTDFTMGFAPVSLRIRPHNSNIEMMMHDVWDNGSPGSPLWKLWTADYKNLMMSHSNVYNRTGSVKNLRDTKFWKNVEENVGRALVNPDKKTLAGRQILESMNIHHNGGKKATADELLARLETHMDYQVGFGKRNPIKVMDEVQRALSGKKPDTKFIENLYNSGQLEIDVDAARHLARLRKNSSVNYKPRKETHESFSDLPYGDKLKQSLSKKDVNWVEKLITHINKVGNEKITDEAIQSFIDKRLTPTLFYGSVGGLGGYGLYKSAQDD